MHPHCDEASDERVALDRAVSQSHSFTNGARLRAWVLGLAALRTSDGRGRLRLPTAVILACVLALMPASAAAQPMVGLRLGLSKTNVYGDDVGSGGFRTGLLGGGWLRIPLGSVVSIQLEANLAQKGFKESVDQSSAGLKLDYLDLPLLLQLTKRENSIQGVFSLGGAFGLMRSCKVFVRSPTVSAEVECDTLNANGTVISARDWDVSIIFGTALEFNGGPFIFGLVFRGQVGATDAINLLIDDVNIEYGKARNGALELQATVGIPFR